MGTSHDLGSFGNQVQSGFELLRPSSGQMGIARARLRRNQSKVVADPLSQFLARPGSHVDQLNAGRTASLRSKLPFPCR